MNTVINKVRKIARKIIDLFKVNIDLSWYKFLNFGSKKNNIRIKVAKTGIGCIKLLNTSNKIANKFFKPYFWKTVKASNDKKVDKLRWFIKFHDVIVVHPPSELELWR